MNNNEYKTFTDQWMQSCEYLERNKTSMKAAFEMRFSNGKFNITCKSIDSQYSNYKEELEKLANYIAKGAYVVAFNVICNSVDVKSEDKEAETAFRKESFADSFPEYLNDLLCNGRDSFINLIYTHAAMLDSSYQMRNMRFNGKNWCNFKGEALINGMWTSEDGSRYADAASGLLMQMTA